MKLGPYRAAARIAWRQARRAPWRSALVIAMVALPISALSLAGVVIVTASPTPEERAAGMMGQAEIFPDSYAGRLRPSHLLRVLPAGSRVISVRYEGSTELVGGTLLYLNVQEPTVPITQAVMRGLYEIVEGRAPRAPGEIALSPDVMEQVDAGIGERIRLQAIDERLLVTGTVIAPESLGVPLAVTAPGTLDPPPSGEVVGPWFIDLPPGDDVQEVLEAIRRKPWRVEGSTRAEVASQAAADDEERIMTGASFGATLGALFGTGLVAAAAFAVGFRRQLRTLGLIGAAGGDRGHVRATVLFGGVTLGLVGSAAGILLGLAGAFALHPHLNHLAGRLVGPLEFPLSILGGGLLLGTLAATGAAVAPARRAARLSTVDALAGHTPSPRPPGRVARAGLVLVGVGTGGVAVATAGRSEVAVGVGFVVMLIGFLLAIPLLVEWVGRGSRFLPTTLRLAARHTARYGRRTGAAIAAATLALTLPVAVSAATLSEEGLQAREARLGEDQLLIGGYDPVAEQQEPPAALIRDLQALMPEAIVAPLRPAVFPRTEGATAFVEGGMGTIEGEGGAGATYREGGELMIGTPDLLRAIDAEGGIPALAQGRVVAVGQNSTSKGQVLLHLDQGGRERLLNIEATEVDGTVYLNETVPRWLISAKAAGRLGLEPGRAREWLLRDPGGLSGEEEDRAHASAARYPGAYVLSASDLLPTAAPYRLIATGISVVIALAIVAVAVALLATESRRDHAIMVAVGAEPHTRRTVVGATAFLVAAMAAVLALPAGFLPVAVVQAARRASYPVVVPWFTMAVVVGVVPLLAAGLAAAASRQPKPVDLLQPTW